MSAIFFFFFYVPKVNIPAEEEKSYKLKYWNQVNKSRMVLKEG